MKIDSPEVCDNCAYNLKREISGANDQIVKLDARYCQKSIFLTKENTENLCEVKYILKKYEELKNKIIDTNVIWESEDKTMAIYESNGKFCIAYSVSSSGTKTEYMDSLNFLLAFETGYKTALTRKKT